MPAKMGNVYSVPGSRFHDGAFGIDFEFFAVYADFNHIKTIKKFVVLSAWCVVLLNYELRTTN
jgi:hypothetical protein